MEYEVNGNTNCIGEFGTALQKLGKGNGRVGNRRTSRENLNDSIVKTGRNTKQSPGDMRRLIFQGDNIS